MQWRYLVKYSGEIDYADIYDYLINAPGSYIRKSNTIFSLFNLTFLIIFPEKAQ